MHLTELEPRWWAMAGRHGQGVSFLCPHCVRGPKMFRCQICGAVWRFNPAGSLPGMPTDSYSLLAGSPVKPCCDQTPTSGLEPVPTTRLGVAFKNPLDGGAPFERSITIHLANIESGLYDVPPGFLWERIGDTFANLTLRPSVDASKSGHWHGFVALGEVTP